MLSSRTVLGAMLFVSGVAALTYQVVWQRLMTLYYGIGPVSIAIVVSVFMLGLGLGGLAGGRLSAQRRISVRMYVTVEILIGLFGLASVALLEALGQATAGAEPWVVAVSSFAFLCMPTLLMGATLPLVIQILSRAEPELLANLGFLYFVNTLGAAAGAFLSCYLFITFLGLSGAVVVAAILNFSLAFLVLLLPPDSKQPDPAPVNEAMEAAPLPAALVYWLVFATGFVAIGYQIVWYRVNGVLLKDSPYAFATVLGVYLCGLALGSRWIERRSSLIGQQAKLHLFLGLNFSIAVCAATTIVLYCLVARSSSLRFLVDPVLRQMVLPVLPGMAGADFMGSVYSFLAMLLWPAFFMVLPTFMMGASFPLATSMLGRRGKAAGATVGRAYFVAIAGNTLGGLVTGFILLPRLGTEWTLLAFLAFGFSFLLLAKGPLRFSWPARLAAFAFVAASTAWIFPARGELYPLLHTRYGNPVEQRVAEGIEGVVLAQRVPPLVYNFINGSSHGAYPGPSYYRAAYHTLAHAPTAKSVLVIGFGAGSVTEAVLASPGLSSVTLVEVNATLLGNLRRVPEIRPILEHPHLEIVVDDARRHLIRSTRRYDAVLMDPLRTTSAYSNNIYSIEFLELLRTRLAPRGVVMIWTDNFSVLPRTVATVFPYVRLYRKGCSFMIVSSEPLSEDMVRYAELSGSAPTPVRAEAASSPCTITEERDAILARTTEVPVNRDYHPVAEYYLRGFR